MPNDTNPAFTALAMPAQVSFPVLGPGMPASLYAAGYNVILVPDALCTTYFAEAACLSPQHTDGPDRDIRTDLHTEHLQPWRPDHLHGRHQNDLGTRRHLDHRTDALPGSDSGSSASSAVCVGLPPFDLSIIVRSGTSCKKGGGINFSGDTEFDTDINVLLYTPCTATFTVNPSMNGQILARTGISATNQFALNFDDLAAFDVPGASYPSAPVVTVQSKTVSSG